MIIEPDFLDHWKTQMLFGLTHDKSSPLLIIRLWSHCQQRKAWEFPEMSNEALKAVCRWEGEGSRLREVLTECGFLDKDCEYIRVHEWEVVNNSLVRNWINGLKGGRKSKPTTNPAATQTQSGLTHDKPKDNPTETQTPKNDKLGKPIDKIEEIDKIDKRRGSKSGAKRAFVPPTLDECKAYAIELGLPEIEGESFLDKYKAQDWKLKGNIAMSDWQASMRTWKRTFMKYGGVLAPSSARTGAEVVLRAVSEKWLRARFDVPPIASDARLLATEYGPGQRDDIKKLAAQECPEWWSKFEPMLNEVLAEVQT